MKLGRIGLVPLVLILVGVALVVAYTVSEDFELRPYNTRLTAASFGPPVLAILVGACIAGLALLLHNRGWDPSGTLPAVMQLALGVLSAGVSFWLLTGFEAMMAHANALGAAFADDCFDVPCTDRDYLRMSRSGMLEELSARLMTLPSMRLPCYSTPSACAAADRAIALNPQPEVSEGYTLPGLTWAGYLSRVSASLFALLATCAVIWGESRRREAAERAGTPPMDWVPGRTDRW